MADEAGDEFSEGWLESRRGHDEAHHDKGRERLGGFDVWREAMGRGVKGNFKEVNGRGWRDKGLDFLDVLWGVHKGYGVTLLF